MLVDIWIDAELVTNELWKAEQKVRHAVRPGSADSHTVEITIRARNKGRSTGATYWPSSRSRSTERWSMPSAVEGRARAGYRARTDR